MKAKFLLFGLGMSILLGLLTGCRVVFTEEASLKEEKPVKPQKVMLNASVTLKSQKIIIRGDSSLPSGSVLYVMLKPYDENATREEIEPYLVEPDDVAVTSEVAKVDKEGSIELTVLKRPDPSQRYRLDLMFIPDKQPKDIKLGENLKNNESYTKIQENGKTLSGLLLHVNIFKEDEFFGDNITMDFIPKQNRE
ncbi:hypothetical protein [Rossellomorea aquimaris]|uniref:Lipoprotein n=1 Tax=Rossellomorea aquimaris TaxID=189382 RepID=A0A366ELX7_9BACI|nr:hypothetical protein [Rossellomorea aquimaris]RBP03393.1 hypothetical protein DET59_10987 [Rossellomorea aquimaris]